MIDDEVIIRKGIVKKIWEAGGAQYQCVGEASNGIKGLELIREKSPDFIITDMKMNKMDGVKFLEQLREENLQQPVIVISSFKDFEYMHKAIESRVIGYVLKPFSAEEIAGQLKKAAEEIEKRRQLIDAEKKIIWMEEEDRTKNLQRIILGAEEEVPSGEQGGFGPALPMVMVTVNAKSRKAYELAFTACGEIKGSIQWAVVQNTLSKRQFFVLLYMEEDREQYLLLRAKRVCEKIKELYDRENMGSIFCVIGGPVEHFSRLKDVQKNNDRLLRGIMAGEKSRIIEDDAQDREYRLIYSKECMDDWVRRMKYDISQCSIIMESFFQSIDISIFTLGDIKKTVDYMIRQINDYASSKGVESDDIMRYFDTRYIFEMNLRKMQQEISGYILLILQSVTGNKAAKNDMFGQIIDFMQRNYRKKITVQTAAESLFVSQAAVRGALKEKGVAFNEYLTEIRVGQAKRMLSETEFSIEFISSEIGYVNPKYFFKVFKRETGKTPQEYRKLYRDK